MIKQGSKVKHISDRNSVLTVKEIRKIYDTNNQEMVLVETDNGIVSNIKLFTEIEDERK